MSIDSIDDVDQETQPETGTSRRNLVTKGVVAAAVAAVATGGLTKNVHAGNGTGAVFNLGVTNTAVPATKLSGGSTLEVTDGYSSGNASIYGVTTGSTTIASNYGVRGDNNGSTGAGVYGRMLGTAGVGVRGEASTGGYGVYGEHTGTTSGVGVMGKTAVGTGAFGLSASGNGVAGSGSIDLAAVGSGRIQLQKTPTPAPTSGGPGGLGTIAKDATGSLWYCYATNKWHKLAGPTTSGAFHAIAPQRVYDSRAGEAPLAVAKGVLNTGQERVVDCTVNNTLVPATAKAVVLNLTAANAAGRGNLAVYPDGTAAPTTSTVNYTPGVNIANSTTSGCGPGAKIKVKAGGSTGADFIIDIVGYYE